MFFDLCQADAVCCSMNDTSIYQFCSYFIGRHVFFIALEWNIVFAFDTTNATTRDMQHTLCLCTHTEPTDARGEFRWRKATTWHTTIPAVLRPMPRARVVWLAHTVCIAEASRAHTNYTGIQQTAVITATANSTENYHRRRCILRNHLICALSGLHCVCPCPCS